MSLILFLSCLAPEPENLAVQACRVMPGVSLDAAGLAMSDGLFDEAERALWADQGPSLGLIAAGIAGYGVIRANSSCRVNSLEPTAEGWTAQVVRSEPDVDPRDFRIRQVEELPLVERPFSLTLIETADGLRARAGLSGALQAARAAEELREKGDIAGSIDAFRALHERLPDPMLLWEIDEGEGILDVRETFTSEITEDGRLIVSHQGPPKADLILSLRSGALEESIVLNDLVQEVEITRPLSEELMAEPGEPSVSITRVEIYR